MVTSTIWWRTSQARNCSLISPSRTTADNSLQSPGTDRHTKEMNTWPGSYTAGQDTHSRGVGRLFLQGGGGGGGGGGVMFQTPTHFNASTGVSEANEEFVLGKNLELTISLEFNIAMNIINLKGGLAAPLTPPAHSPAQRVNCWLMSLRLELRNTLASYSKSLAEEKLKVLASKREQIETTKTQPAWVVISTQWRRPWLLRKKKEVIKMNRTKVQELFTSLKVDECALDPIIKADMKYLTAGKLSATRVLELWRSDLIRLIPCRAQQVSSYRQEPGSGKCWDEGLSHPVSLQAFNYEGQPYYCEEPIKTRVWACVRDNWHQSKWKYCDRTSMKSATSPP